MSSLKFRLSIAASALMLFAMAIPISFAAAQWVEFRYFPVMRWFGVQSVQHVDGGQVLSGEMFKARDCKTIQFIAYDMKGRLLSVQFLADPPGAPLRSRAVGLQEFHGILITPDTPIAAFYVRHSCHVLWDSVTDLMALPDNQSEYDKGEK